MKRRGFLGFMGGAVAAGPKLATSITDQGDRLLPHGVGSYGVEPEATGSWKPQRIAELRRLLSGVRAEDDDYRARSRHLSAMESADRFRLDGLRSVAGHHKATMLHQSNERRRAEWDENSNRWELFNLLKGKS